jgi:hypothetical protein
MGAIEQLDFDHCNDADEHGGSGTCTSPFD